MITSTTRCLTGTAALFLSLAFLPFTVSAHCQIPCGIYDDHARVNAMLEDAATVAKATKLIAELAGKGSSGQPCEGIYDCHGYEVLAPLPCSGTAFG